MSAARLVVRLDIDTIVCMRPGVEGLLGLAREKGVRFTFFVNMGRAVSYASSIRKVIGAGRPKTHGPVRKLPAREKLGLKGLLATLAFNPEVGNRYPQLLESVVNEGHDLGLHGGRNHGEWHHNAASWSEDKVREEIQWGISAMTKLGLPAPILFSSPGFTTPDGIAHILSELGFKVLADAHSGVGEALYADPEVLGFKHANTTLLGEPGAVGYIASVIAGAQPFSEVEKALKARLLRGDAILYDHPCLAGRGGVEQLSRIIDTWVGSGGEVVPLSGLIS